MVSATRKKLVAFDGGREIFFATKNLHKFKEAELVVSRHGITLKHLDFKAAEIQSDSLKDIASNCLTQVMNVYALPVIVEDAGLFIEALNGFPGPYSSYVYRTIGVGGVLRLMRKVENRKACFISAVAYGKPRVKPVTFIGRVEGLITRKSRGKRGFGFDPIFKPVKSSKTFAEMTPSQKNEHSHRAAALRKLVEWVNRRGTHTTDAGKLN